MLGKLFMKILAKHGFEIKDSCNDRQGKFSNDSIYFGINGFSTATGVFFSVELI